MKPLSRSIPAVFALAAAAALLPGAAIAQSGADIDRVLKEAHAKFASLAEGKNADYIPELAKVDSKLFGIAVVTTDNQSVAVMWETFSDWLLTAGMIIAGLAIIAFVIDVVGGKQIRTLTWPHAVGYVLAVLLSLVNAFVHSRDGYTAVVPTGLALSGLVVAVLILTAGVASALANRRAGA